MRILTLLILLALPDLTWAVEEIAEMKCKNGVVRPDSDTVSLLKKCGEPAARNHTPDQPLSMGSTPFNATEEWSYRSGNLEYVVMINGSAVVKLFREQRR